jgi:Mn2+/Fe2+ NRAMP family transporter
MSSSTQVVPEGRPVRLWPLWFGILGPPAAWAVQLLVAYSAEELACSRGSLERTVWGLSVNALGIAMTIFGVSVTVASAWGSRRALKSLKNREDDPAVQRSAFMASFGLYSAVFFLIVILLTAVGPLGIPSCR